MKNKTCCLCGSSGNSIVRNSRDFDFFPEESFSYVKCAGCGLVYLNPVPEEKDMIRYYPDDYYVTPDDKRFDFARFDRAKYIAERQKPGNILDIGSNRGYFLKEMHNHGWNVYGCELSPFASKYAEEKLGLKNITCGDFTNAGYENDFFDAITLWNVIEHLPDPVSAIRKAFRLLKKGGMLYLDTQNFSSLFSRIFRQNWYQLDAPRHLFQFTPGTINKALTGAGFKMAGTKSCEPFITMVSFKVSVKRALGKSTKVSRNAENMNQEFYTPPKRNILWVVIRNFVDYALLALSAILTYLKLGDTMFASAKKE